MTDTPQLALPLIAAAQAQKHVTHNEALAMLDALLHLSVKERNRTAPPGTPEEGDRYLLGEGATGIFAARDGQIASFAAGAWLFLAPKAGWRVHVEAEKLFLIFDGAVWRNIGVFVRELGQVDRLGIGIDADDVNRFSAKLNTALFSARNAGEGGSGDLRFVLNKEGEADVLSQLYQRGFSGRAETGLIGSDNFGIRVSADGSAWTDAVSIDCASGIVTFPAGVGGFTGVPQPNLLINAAFRVNQRNYINGTLSPGAYSFDRWRAGTGGCALTRGGDGTILLNGPLEQVVEVAQAPALAGTPNFAGLSLTFSVEDPSIPLPVLIGTRSATIPAGPGRRSATVTLATSETTNIVVRLHPTSACGFRRPKLELGTKATPWEGVPVDIDELRCRQFYQRVPIVGTSPGEVLVRAQRMSTNIIECPIVFSPPMRSAPGVASSSLTWATTTPTGSSMGFVDAATGNWVTATGAVSLALAISPSAHGVALRFQAATSFSGSPGTTGYIYVGPSWQVAFSAEP